MDNEVKDPEASAPEPNESAAPAAAEPQAEAEKPVAAEPQTEAEKPADAPPTEAEKSAEKKKRRRRIVKRVLVGVGIAFGVVLLVAILALVFRDPLAKFLVGRIGSSQLGVKVQVDKIETSLTRGSLRVRKFSVGNPAGYSDNDAVALGELYVRINIRSLFTKKIVVEEVNVQGLKIGCEVSGLGINFLDIYEHYKKKNPPKEKKKKEEKPAPQVVIRHLAIKDSAVSVAVSVGAAQVPSLHIKLDREMKDIGEKNDKGAFEELAGEFVAYRDKIFKFIEVNNIGGKLKSGYEGFKSLF